MLTDTSYWVKYNPKVAFETTQKQFFGKYVFRVTYAVPSALFINKAKPGKMKEYLDWRRVQAMTRTGGIGVYNAYWTRDITSKTDEAMLEHFSSLKQTHDKIKYRLEASSFGIYSNDESELKTFHDAIIPAYQNALLDVTCPKDAAHRTLLEAGHITNKNKKGYKYKVTFRDGKYDVTAKQQLINYFDSLGDMVTVSKATRRSLTNGHAYTWGNYVHTSDTSILTFVDLIIPGIVNKIFEITKI